MGSGAIDRKDIIVLHKLRQSHRSGLVFDTIYDALAEYSETSGKAGNLIAQDWVGDHEQPRLGELVDP